MTELTSRETAPFLEGLHFGESPRWHEGRLWFADFYQSAVLSVGESGDVRVEVVVPGEPGGLGWMPDGRLLSSTRKPRTVVRLESDGRLVEHGDLKPTAAFYGNDMVVDAAGRAYVGNFGFDFDAFVEEHGELALVEPPGAPRTRLIRVDPDGSAHVATDDLYFPNGTVITPDGRTLIVAETLAGRLTAFDIDGDGKPERAPGLGRVVLVCTGRDMPRRRGPDLGGQRHVRRVSAGGRGWRGGRPRDHHAELLRVHARGRRPSHALPDDGAHQRRGGGQRPAGGAHRADPGGGTRRRSPLNRCPGQGPARVSAAGSAPGGGCGCPGRCAARSR